VGSSYIRVNTVCILGKEQVKRITIFYFILVPSLYTEYDYFLAI
jgi:hypothetical protein